MSNLQLYKCTGAASASCLVVRTTTRRAPGYRGVLNCDAAGVYNVPFEVLREVTLTEFIEWNKQQGTYEGYEGLVHKKGFFYYYEVSID